MLGHDERQGSDPWDVLLGLQRSRVRWGTSSGYGGGGWKNLGTGPEEGMGYPPPTSPPPPPRLPPAHENQMKCRLDDSLGQREEEREKNGS